VSARQKEETPGLAGVGGFEGKETKRQDCACDDEQRKRFDTLRACLALRGFAVVQTDRGLLIERWGMSRLVADADELQRFAERAGAMP
jgi:hypothetical protein